MGFILVSGYLPPLNHQLPTEKAVVPILLATIHVVQELDSKQRKIRSLRGFFLYALEIMETGKDYEILNTNLQPFFWRKVQTIIRQNKKGALLEFLFGYDIGREQANKSTSEGSSPTLQEMEDQIQNLQSQVDSLQQKKIQLEQDQTLEVKKALSESERSEQA